MKIDMNGSICEVSNPFVIEQMLKHGGEKVIEPKPEKTIAEPVKQGTKKPAAKSK